MLQSDLNHVFNACISIVLQSLNELTDKAVPKHIQLRRELKLEEPLSKLSRANSSLAN